MKLGNFRNFIFVIIFLFVINKSIFAADKIETVPLINLEELSPTFEEEKEELDKNEYNNISQSKVGDNSSKFIKGMD